MAAAAFERLHELEGVMDVLLDERVGLIRALRQRPREAGDANIFEFVARACDTSAFSRLKNFGDTGGASVDPSRAVAKAIGEGIERYCSAIFEPTDFTVATYAEAPFNCVAPQDFALYGASQYAQPDFPFEPFTDTTPVRWVGGLDPLKLEICHVPAAMVFVPYFFYLGSGEVPISQPISTGLACHFGSTAAAASAVCEVIERDAFMITWQAQMSRAKIRRDSLSEANLDLIARLEIRGGRVEVLDMTMDVGVTTVLSVLRGASKSAAVIVAGSADARPENAVRKSLEELEHTRRYSQSLYEDMARDSPGSSEAESDFAHIVDQSSHLSFWTQPRHSQFAARVAAAMRRRRRAPDDPVRAHYAGRGRARHVGHARGHSGVPSALHRLLDASDGRSPALRGAAAPRLSRHREGRARQPVSTPVPVSC